MNDRYFSQYAGGNATTPLGEHTDDDDYDDIAEGTGLQISFPSNLNSADFELGHVVQFGFLVDPRASANNIHKKVLNYSEQYTAGGSPNPTDALSGNIKVAGDKIADRLFRTKKQRESGLKADLNASLTGGIKQQTQDTIALYMPSIPQANYAHNYNTSSISALGAGLAESADLATDAGLALFDAFASIPRAGSFNIRRGEFFKQFGKFFDASGKIKDRFMGGAAQAMGVSAVNSMGGILAATMQQIHNPRLEMLYQSTAPRTFTYTFKMNPSSEDESETIQQIIHKFKVASHPSIKQNTGKHVLRYPAEILIKHMSYGKENKYINRIHDCVCTGVTVDYNTEGSFQAHRPTGKGAPPATVTLTLNFQETEMMTADMIHGGGY